MTTIARTKLLSAAALFLLIGCRPPLENVATETYANNTYGYSFSYPASKDFKEYSNIAQAIGTLDGEIMEADVEVTVYESDPSIDTLFTDFIPRILINSCAADGPGGSIECTDIQSENSFTTKNGLEGKSYYLTWREENFETEEETTERKGPFIVFPLLPERSSRFTALVIRPGFDVDADDIDTDLIEEIANSLRLGVQTSSAPVRDRAGEGEFCGGIAGFLCEDGLDCLYDGDYPDAGGICVRSGSAASRASSLTSEQQLVDTYIRANIHELSPEPEVLGGTFYVTEIAWTGENGVLVSYEDGHIALRARGTYTVSGSTVMIDSFDVVER